MNKPNVKHFGSGALLLVTLLLAGCAAPLTASTGVTCPRPAAIPELSPSLKKPPPPESFLEAATKRSSEWLQKLTASETK